MRATTLLQRQLTAINGILHDLANDLTPAELTTRVLPQTNLLAFDFWHIARAQDWAVQTLVRGIPELIDAPEWQGRGQLVTHGIGVGLSETQADELARSLQLADILAYADAVHQQALHWLDTLTDDALDTMPDVPAHLARYLVYLELAMRAEVPWMFEQPPTWRCLNPATGHVREHLAVIEFLKQRLRAH